MGRLFGAAPFFRTDAPRGKDAPPILEATDGYNCG